ncbi:MAG: hypothetical protein ABFQ95_02595 [Pseudomonadota bacterium]
MVVTIYAFLFRFASASVCLQDAAAWLPFGAGCNVELLLSKLVGGLRSSSLNSPGPDPKKLDLQKCIAYSYIDFKY